ncbi:PAS domain S-box protein [Vibrio sp. CAIM 722]|uniref:Sensory/regulatory protein RpfC n=1 Tax=Vibrio eleionomae TaxID=2653505 RepID=A0A7X4LNI6_9VIBR|nr:PAS domain S-box protein [Vibrio eleionomae]MZI94917.1 PAS domain S-box protein [Vibrio eleionomae]
MEGISATQFKSAGSFYSRYRLALIVFLVGIIATIVVDQLIMSSNQNHIKESVDEKFDQLYASVSERFSLYRYGLMEARTAILSGGGVDVTRAEINQFGTTLNLDEFFPGARGFGFIRRVPRNEVKAFLAKAKSDGKPNFKINQYAPNFGDSYIVQYMEPEFYEVNSEAIGFDIASEPKRRKTANKALIEGKTQITPPIRLITNPGGQIDSLLILLPLYKGGVIPLNKEQRLEKGFGWISAPLNLSNVLQDIIPHPEKLIFSITDVTEAPDAEPFYSNSKGKGDYRQEQELDIMGRNWRLELSVTPAYISSLHLHSPAATLSIGLSMSILLALVVGMFTTQRANRSRLIHEQTKLHAIVESSADGIIGKTLEGRIISWNAGAEKIFGYKREEAIGRLLKELVIPERLQYEEDDILSRITNGETIAAFESIRHRKDGAEFPVSATVSPILNFKGEVVGAAKTVRDISMQKAAENKIRELNANLEQQVAQRTAELEELNVLLSNVLSAAYEYAIVATDTTGLIKLFNHGAELMLGLKAEEVVDKEYPVIFHDIEEVKERGEELSRIHGRPIEGIDVFLTKAKENRSESSEWTYIDSNGHRFPINLVVSAMRDNQGDIVGYLGIAADITEQKKAEQALKDAKESADAANQAKSMFLANMSHEIRTPMNAVLGMLQLLLKTSLSQKQYDFASKAKIAATSLLSLLNDILDYSKIESGKLELDPHPFNFNGLMEHLAVVMSGNLRDKSIELLFDLDETVPYHLIGDELRLQQVLLNLISNAIKFTDVGEVVVNTRLHAYQNGQATIRIGIRDSGIGISPEQQQKIFEGFTQAEASITRRYGGTGLGLVICRRLLDLMGADLKLESRLGEGSEFYFTVTLPVNNNIHWQPELFENAPKILVVDDNEVARMMAADTLVRLGARVESATSGKETFDAIKRAVQKNDPFACVLLDWLMPDLNGVDVAKHIHAFMEPHPPKIILISAASQGDLPVVEEGTPFNLVLSKPVTPHQLFNSVLDVLENRALASADIESEEHDEPLPLSGLNILLVEDNTFNQEVATELLESAGAQVYLAEDGKKGIDILFANHRHFDLVLMDMQMPNMDGLTATRKIREREEYQQLPIVAMTANVSPEDREACFNAGMNDHLGKPLDFTTVIHVIAKNIGLQSEKMTKVSHGGSSIDAVIQRFGGNEALYRSILNRFMESFDDLVVELQDQIEHRQWQQVMASLHTIKGSAGTAGLDKLYRSIIDIEKQAKQLDLDQNGTALFKVGFADSLLKMARDEHSMLAALLGDEQEQRDTHEEEALDVALLLDELENNLAMNNMNALSLVDTLSQQYPNNKHISALHKAVDDLDFVQAQAYIGPVRESL